MHLWDKSSRVFSRRAGFSSERGMRIIFTSTCKNANNFLARLFQSSAIVGGNLMPHSLYVGSSLVHARLREFDIKEDLYPDNDAESVASVAWKPSYRAIKATLGYTFAELCISIFVIAVFVNTAILVV